MTSDHLHVVQFSGGITSWAAARRVADKHGTDGLVLLFADTLIEDEDLHRFLDDASADIGVPVTRVADGRTPTQVFRDRRFIGNSMSWSARGRRVKPCAHGAAGSEANCPTFARTWRDRVLCAASTPQLDLFAGAVA